MAFAIPVMMLNIVLGKYCYYYFHFTQSRSKQISKQVNDMVDVVEESEAIINQCESPPIVPGNSNTQTVDNTTSELTAEPATNDETEGNEHASKLLQSLVSRLAAYCSELSSGIAV